MTKEEFIDKLQEYYPSTKDMLRGTELPTVMNCAVQYFWMNNTPEDDFTQYFRLKYKELSMTGMKFD